MTTSRNTLPVQLAAACSELARQLRAGQGGRVEDVLAAHPELAANTEAALELILTEFEVRRELGEKPVEEIWFDRFPRWRDDLRQLFEVKKGFEGLAAAPYGGTRAEELPGALTPPTDYPYSPLSTPSSPGPLPEIFGRYRILRRLGQGGMGSVYLAHDTDLDRRVALKMPQLSYADDGLAERFLREARAVATLDHPNVCPIHDVGEVDGVPYLTMAFLDGRPLSEHARQGEPMPQREAAALVRELAEALAYVHRQGVVHRDLKPSNIMLAAEGRPILVDFGLAVRLNRDDPRLTADGAIVGTPSYMAPEQVLGEKVGPASDIYALGVVLYELLTGRLPFTGGVGEILAQVARDEPRPPRALRRDVDRALEAICLRAMAKRPEARYANMDELAVALRDYLDGKARAPRPRLAVLAGAVIACAGLALMAVLLRPPAEKPDPGANPPKEKEKDKRKPPSVLPPQLFAALLKDLDGDDVAKATLAAKSLKDQGITKAVPALEQRVTDKRWRGGDRDPSKEAALDALKELGPGRVTEALTRAARADVVEMRRWACDRLGDQQEPGVVKFLETQLRDPDMLVRARAARSLGRIGDRAAVDALVARVTDHRWEPDVKGVDRSKDEALDALKALEPDRVADALKSVVESKTAPAALRSWAAARRNVAGSG